MNRRRHLLAVVGLCALAAPLRAFAQQPPRIWRVGFLALRRRPDSLNTDYFGAFPRGMRELDYVEGKNLVIEWRFADGNSERLPALATELVQLKVDVVVAASTPSTRAAQQATTTIPIVMVAVSDPVISGFVASLSRPAGNITGLSNLTSDLSAKYLEMLLAMVPRLSRVGVLVHPANSAVTLMLKGIQAAAQTTSVKILPVEVRTPQEIENAFSMMIRQNAGGVIVVPDALFIQQQRQIVELARIHRLPAMFGIREYVEAGGLMSYGPNFADMYRRVAAYVDKILKGAKPGDIPVEQPTKVELFINRKTSKALGLTIPQELLLRADEVIE
jgi:putative ABC transport system substrate-binding protein